MSRFKICLECNGKGEVPSGNESGESEDEWLTCSDCDGTGEIEGEDE